jgi:EmrB/QacA subfamily drug resistance transporter
MSRATDAATTRSGLSTARRRQIALIGLSVGQLLTILDATAVNVALPSIQANLHISPASLSWVVNAYLLTFGGCLLVAGRLGDLIGRKKVFIVGVTLFTLASLLCGLSESAAMLTAARFLQGIGAAVECAMVLGILVSLYPDPHERAKAVGVYAFIGASGGSIGLLIGGALTQALSWHWIFLINLPFGVVALVIALTVIDEHEGLGLSKGVDIAGGFLVTAAAVFAVYGFVQSDNDGWASPVTVGCLAAAVVLAIAFVIVEEHHQNPLVPRRILHSRNLVCVGAVRALFCFGSYAAFFLLVLYLQQVLKYGPVGNGLGFLPTTILISGLSLFVTPRLMRFTGGKAMMTLGLLLFGSGIVLLIFIPSHGTYYNAVLPAMLVIGVGSGAFNVPNVTLAMAESADEDSGVVSGVINVSQQLGAAMGIAVAASVSAARTSHQLAKGVAATVALTDGFRVGFLIASISLLGAAGCAVFVRSSRVTAEPGSEAQVAIQVIEIEAL